MQKSRAQNKRVNAFQDMTYRDEFATIENFYLPVKSLGQRKLGKTAISLRSLQHNLIYLLSPLIFSRSFFVISKNFSLPDTLFWVKLIHTQSCMLSPSISKILLPKLQRKTDKKNIKGKKERLLWPHYTSSCLVTKINTKTTTR